MIYKKGRKIRYWCVLCIHNVPPQQFYWSVCIVQVTEVKISVFKKFLWAEDDISDEILFLVFPALLQSKTYLAIKLTFGKLHAFKI